MQALIEHVDRVHTGVPADVTATPQRRHRPRSATTTGLQRCPECGEGFADAVQLVRHVEAHRYQQRAAAKPSTECVIC